ncbi:putative CoA-binding protein [Peteryoungia aggregata LMG 23059]|uniref:CoA-binding protein n=1 Tax=Peteryoungia aggregata LMG 23059 TaxID=1368425 RepID=A0ABU0G8N4_9HYPH|nr:CoA-binding protein [Peteryoungia aggregata]MDQ0421677.1 putative CoA-binding protein [Peteryoungia aggregata LMG 23059]
MADHDDYSAEDLKAILGSVQTVALLGASPKPDRPSFGVMQFLLSKGYRVFPVNPGQAGKQILGQTVYATMADIPEAIDMVDVFRAPEYLGEVVSEALALPNRPKVIWGQLSVRDDEAVKPAEEAGIRVVMDRCPAIEIPRLGL